MKKPFLPIAFLMLLVLTSCQKKGVRLFQGDYSYKTSGSVTVAETASENTTTPLAFGINLKNELGHLEIVNLDKENDSVLVVMNAMGGNVDVARAHTEDDRIRFADFTKKLHVVNLDLSLDFECPVTVHAEGNIYDGNLLLLKMQYEGEYAIMNKVYAIRGTDITLTAQRN